MSEAAGDADGLAWVIQNESLDALGGYGGGLGYDGISNSVAVEFDTYFNYEGDVGISVHTGGTGPNSSGESYSLGSAPLPYRISDGLEHTGRVEYISGSLAVYLDDQRVLSVALDLADTLDLNAGKAWVGFTAATGSLRQNHDILSVTHDSSPKSPRKRYHFMHFNMAGAARHRGTFGIVRDTRRSIEDSNFRRPVAVSLNEICKPQFDHLLDKLDEHPMSGEFVTTKKSAKRCSGRPYGIALLIAQRFWIDEEPSVIPLEVGTPNGETRHMVCVRADLILLTRVCSTHIVGGKSEKTRERRRSQISIVAGVVDSWVADDEPVVLMGDFNATPSSPALNPIYSTAYFRGEGHFLEVDGFDYSGNPCGSCGSSTTRFSGKIDYIFVSEDHWGSLRAKVTKADSDHRMLRGSGLLDAGFSSL